MDGDESVNLEYARALIRWPHRRKALNMTDKPNPEDIKNWNRWFAVECNNGAWNLASKSRRSPDEDQAMVYLAYSAAYHWSTVENPVNNARADTTLSHALSLAGKGEEALTHANRALAFFEKGEGTDWDIAFSHAEIALAAAVKGDKTLHSKHYALAKQKGEVIKGEEDRKIFMEEFAKIPSQVRVK